MNCRIPWSNIFSNNTCLCCLRRRPEALLPCGHSLCDICLQIFGEAALDSEYTYELPACLLCAAEGLTRSLKPPTAGVRILSIDGGGSRGVIPLEFLSILQGTFGETCPIHDLFDLAFGTSSGRFLDALRQLQC